MLGGIYKPRDMEEVTEMYSPDRVFLQDDSSEPLFTEENTAYKSDV